MSYKIIKCLFCKYVYTTQASKRGICIRCNKATKIRTVLYTAKNGIEASKIVQQINYNSQK